MSYNGSGTFQINTSGQPVVAGTVISSTAFNALTADLATGLSTAITKDGQTATTVRIPFAAGINSSLVTDSSSTSTGSIITAGGVGVAKNVYVGTAVQFVGSTSGSVGLQAKAVAGSTTFKLPSADGTSNQAMVTDGSGNLSFATISPSAATPTALGTVYGKTDTSNLAFLGYQAGNSNTGAGNTAVGYKAAFSNTSGTTNTAIGNSALYTNTTASDSVAVGRFSLYSNNGIQNTSVGTNTMYENTTGTNNTAVGQAALYSNTTGASNTAIGKDALNANTTGTPNTALGRALRSVTTGGQNVGIGDLAGDILTTGTFNTYLGNNINASSSSVINEIVINAAGTTTGKGSSTGFINPNTGGVYQGNNGATWSVTSDQRLKKNIVDNNIGLDKITAIQVRNFEYRLPDEITDVPQDQAIAKTGIQLGVIAQELQQILPECVKTESTGVLSVDADNLTWYLVNAIKELKAEIDALKGA